MKLSVRGEALADLNGIFDYIARESPQAARSVTRRIWHAIQNTVKSFPMIGRAGRAEGTREYLVPRLPYIVVYEVEAERDLVTILAVFHGAQDRSPE